MQDDNKPQARNIPGIRLRIISLVIIFVGATSFIFYNLAKLQIQEYEDYRQKATEQQLKDTVIVPNRGTIYDTNMKVLAQSATVYDVVIDPHQIKQDSESWAAARKKELEKQGESVSATLSYEETIIAGLSTILEVDEQTIRDKVGKTTSSWQWIKKKVDKPTVDTLRQYIVDNNLGSAIGFEQGSKRYYPFGDFASAVLGCVGGDNQGLSGIESYYDEQLTGTPGRIVSAKNGWNIEMPYSYDAEYPATDGHGLVLTIDETIQHVLDKYLAFAVTEHNVSQKGVGIVMDVNTGAILAMSVLPDFDLNDPYTLVDAAKTAEIEAITDDTKRNDAYWTAIYEQWRNKAVNDAYEPGSVFKVVTASAALDSGSATLNNHYTCHGSIVVGGHTMRCAEAGGHGTQSFAMALINSCNPSFIQIGAAMGPYVFYNYLRGFGFTEKTGIDLPGEQKGFVYKAEQLGVTELASSSFGQSSKITPIQMITAVAAAVNGGNLVQPHVVSKILDAEGNIIEELTPSIKRQVISEEVSATISSILEENVVSGHGTYAYVSGYRVGGKSGTSQKLDSGDPEARIASFVGFAPANDPQIAVLVVLDEPHSYSSYGGQLSAPVVGSVIAEVMPYLGVEASYTSEELAVAEVSVPNTVTVNLAKAQVALQNKGFTPKIIGNGSVVVKQYPTSGTALAQGSTVVLYTEEGLDNNLVTVPNVVGYNAKSAAQILSAAGLNIKRVGSAGADANTVAVTQEVEANTQVPMGTIVTVTFNNDASDGDIYE
ncbi:MAG: penicillin-binding transpeptidase domain-containing protein [Oscillospiraceae bacterium]|nr:penicillin-binding transpeptidase domain-containing protein [Oscillospiraceae bacterium]